MSEQPWCSTCGKDVHTIECQDCSEFWVTHEIEKSDMKEKIQHLTDCLAKSNAQVEDLKSKLGSSSNLAFALATELDRLHAVMETLETDATEYYEAWAEDGCDTKDAIRFVAKVSYVISNTLLPKESEK